MAAKPLYVFMTKPTAKDLAEEKEYVPSAVHLPGDDDDHTACGVGTSRLRKSVVALTATNDEKVDNNTEYFIELVLESEDAELGLMILSGKNYKQDYSGIEPQELCLKCRKARGIKSDGTVTDPPVPVAKKAQTPARKKVAAKKAAPAKKVAQAKPASPRSRSSAPARKAPAKR